MAEKTLHTLHALLHAKVNALADMVFERLSNVMAQDERALLDEWRERSRQVFRDTTQQLSMRPDLPNPEQPETMMRIAEAIWRLEDEHRAAQRKASNP